MRIRLGLKLIGLSALVMGVMAIGTAGVAQAETGACWGYRNAKAELKCFGEAGLEAGVSFAFEGSTGTLLIANLNFEILCTAGSLINGGKLTTNGSITAGQFKLTGCIGLSKTPTLTKLAACTPIDGTELGVILSEVITGLIRLHEGEPTVLFKPVSGTTLFNIHLGLNEECAVGLNLIVKGELVIGDVAGKFGFEEHKLTHTFQEFAKLQLMTVGVNKATIDGNIVFSLDSPHNTLKWAGKAA